MGARFDAAIDADTDYKIGTIALPTLSANDPDMPGTELRSYLLVTSNADDEDMGMFSIGDLLGSGMASDEGANFVDVAVKAIEKVQADVSALLALDSKPPGLDTILRGQWDQLKKALDPIFGTNSVADTNPTSAVRQTNPREEDILDDIADVLDALSSEASFVAATAEDGGGVFASQALGAGAAANAFNRLTWTAEATMGMTGSTRYGTAARKTSANAKKASAISQYGAFSYSTMQQTVRTQDAAAVSLTGIASYSGGTHAVNASGKVYSGTMELQVRFKANSVSGVVSGLQDSDGLAWQHNFADVDRIVLDDGTLRRNAKWTHTGTAGSSATVFYTRDSGLLRPVGNIDNTFDGILLGQGAEAGSEANGTWSVGTSGGSGYLAGGFGVQHVADTARPVPPGDDASAAGAKLFSRADNATSQAVNMTSQSIADGMLTVKQRAYGHRDPGGGTIAYGALSEDYGDSADDDTDDTGYTLITAKFDLTALADKGAGAGTTVAGPTHAAQVISTLTKERDLLATLQSLNSDDTQTAETAAWQRAQNAVQHQLLGNLPMKMDDAYAELESEADAIDLINRALDALSSNANLAAALDPDGTGIFDHYWDDANTDGTVDDDEIMDFVDAAKEKVGGRTFAQIRGDKTSEVIATLGTTSYTRFGVWRRQSRVRAAGGGVRRNLGGPGTFAYSPLDPTNAGTPTNTGFPQGGSASYTGETVALQNTTLLTGTVRVDVSWSADADSSTAGTFDEAVGTMALTISDLASAAGDPLTFGGAPKSNDLETNPSATGRAGTEIADIVIGGLSIAVGATGAANAGQLIVVGSGLDEDGAEATTAADIVAYNEDEPASARLRYTALGTPDNATAPATTGGTGVKALFVGQGVDGPLGVIGTYTINAGTAVTPDNVTSAAETTSIGRLGADGLQSVDVGVTIYGAFGAQVP